MKRFALLLLFVSAACASSHPRTGGIRVTVITRRPMEAGIAGGIVGASYVAPVVSQTGGPVSH